MILNVHRRFCRATILVAIYGSAARNRCPTILRSVIPSTVERSRGDSFKVSTGFVDFRSEGRFAVRAYQFILHSCKNAGLGRSKFRSSDLAAIISAGALMQRRARKLSTQQLNRESRFSIPLIGTVTDGAKIFSDVLWDRDGIKSFWRRSSEWKWRKDS